MSKISYCLSVFLVMLLTACGGGGDDAPATPEVKPSKVDMSFAEVSIDNLESVKQVGSVLSVLSLANEPSQSLQTHYSWAVDLNDDGVFAADELVGSQASLTILESYLSHQIQISVHLESDTQVGPVESLVIGGKAAIEILQGELRGSSSDTILVKKSDGSAVLASYSAALNNIPEQITKQFNNVQSFAVLHDSIALLLADGRVIYWTDDKASSSLTELHEQLHDVMQISANNGAYAALKKDGSVITWGDPEYGGEGSLIVNELDNIKHLTSSWGAFSGVKNDGSVVSWGLKAFAGDSSPVQSQLINVTNIVSNGYSFAALKVDGSVVRWQDGGKFGDEQEEALYQNVQTLYSQNRYMGLSHQGAVIYLENDDDVITYDSVKNQLTEVVQLESTEVGTAALKADGTVVTWGDRAPRGNDSGQYGGDSSDVADKLVNVVKLYKTYAAFAALKKDGSVLAWGDPQQGGNADSVQSSLTDITTVVATGEAFAALKKDGTVLVWGGDLYETNNSGNTSQVFEQLNNIASIYATGNSFIAVKNSGELLIWGQLNPDTLGEAVMAQLNGPQLEKDSDADGIVDSLDQDDDNDGVVDINDAFPLDKSETIDTDNDGIGNNADVDDDNDGLLDELDSDPLTPNKDLDLSISTVQILNAEQANQAGSQLSALALAADPTLLHEFNYRWFVDLNDDGEFSSEEFVDDKAILIIDEAYVTHELQVQVQLISAGQSGPSKFVSIGAKPLTEILSYPKSDMHNKETFVAKRQDGSVVIASTSYDFEAIPENVLAEMKDVHSFYTSRDSIAVLLADKRVIYWDNQMDAASSEALHQQLHDVIQIKTNDGAYAAVKTDGTVVTWGDEGYGGNGDQTHNLVDVKAVESDNLSFTALKNDGTVVDWGYQSNTSTVTEQISNIERLVGSSYDMAGISNDGKVVTWNDKELVFLESDGKPYENVDKLFAFNQFTGLSYDGKVLYRGNDKDAIPFDSVKDQLLNVSQLAFTAYAAAALNADGEVVTWGNNQGAEGGNMGGDSSSVAEQLHDVVGIYSTNGAFAALSKDGQVLAWGEASLGGSTAYVQSQLNNVKQIVSSRDAFAALKHDGTVVVWGGEPTKANNVGNINNIAEQLTDIQSIQATNFSFIAVKYSGEVVIWGHLNPDDLGDALMSKLNPNMAL